MISSEVQRTLVKSPPELWAEISDPEALARHLGEFGEIRITRVQPEQKVEWEAPEASGSIVIKPSGWGTKVKLTVTRELSETGTGPEAQEAAASDLQPDSAGDPEPRDTLEPAGAEVLAEEHPAEEQPAEERPAESQLAEEQLDQAEDTGAASLPPEAHEDQRGDDALPEPAGMLDLAPQSEHEPGPPRRRGFFARLFGRRRGTHAATEGSDVHTPETAADVEEHPEPSLVADLNDAPDQALTLAAEVALVETELDAEAAPAPAVARTQPIAPATPAAAASASESIELVEPEGTVEHASSSDAHGQGAAELSAELERAEEAAQEQVTAVLTAVLDRLGAAHHRPFSRA
jgi:hypothetical protein